MKRFIVYMHTNLNNGNRYIGWCAGTIEKRWNEHCKAARGKSSCYFHNALRKWGSGDDAWRHEVLDVVTTESGVKRAEVLWIQQRRTFAYDDGNRGYNETRGGDGILGYHHTPETRERLRLMNTGANHPQFGKRGANAGRTFSTETREKMRLAHLGKKRSLESCVKQSETLRGKFFSKERKRNISIGKRRKRDPHAL